MKQHLISGFVILLFGFAVALGQAAPQTSKTSAATLTITGVVTDEAGSPQPGRKLWLLGKDFSIKLDGKGNVLSPTVTTDQKGSFTFKIDCSLFPAGEELSLALEYKDSSGMLRWAPLRDAHGVPAELKLEPKLKVLNLGRLTVSIK
jgi:hypothetical protein